MADVASSGQLHEFLRVLRRRRWQIVMPAIFVLALGTVFAVLVPKKYVITTRVELLEGQRAETDQALKDRAGSAVQREVDNVAYHLRNYSRIQQVVEEQAGLWAEYMKADTKGQREVIERIQDDLDVFQIEKRRNEGSTFVDIEFRDVSGDRAVRFLEDLIDKWVREVIERDKINLRRERENFQDARDEAWRAVQEANRQYTELAREMGVDPFLPVAGGNSSRQSDPIHDALVLNEQALQEAAADLAVAQEQHRLARQLLDEAEPLVPADVEGDLFKAQQYAEAAIQEIEDAISRLTPSHTDHKKGVRQIEEIQERLAEEEEKLLQEPPLVPNEQLVPLQEAERLARTALAAAQAREKQLMDSRREMETERDRRIGQMGQLTDLKRILDEKEEAYQEIARLFNDKEISLGQLSAYEDPYDIIQAPEVEGAPREPSPILLVLMAAFAGLALGLSTAMAAEYARNSYRTVGDVASVMPIPVLGTVDQIVTSIEARRIQARRAVVGLSSAVILGGLAWFTWIWAVSPDKLPIEVKAAVEEFRKLLM